MADTADSPDDRAAHLIRDLHWSVNSADPCQRPDQWLWQDHSAWFHEWIGAGAGLSADQVDRLWTLRQGRLGHYFEALWRHYIESSPHWTLHLAHSPIREPGPDNHGQRTLGEIDLVIGNETEVIHLELAVKFYLRLSGQNPVGDDHWAGPGLADTLGRKLRHLRQRQLPLSHHPQVARRVSRAITRRRFILKGRFFEPAHATLPRSTPQWLTAEQCRLATELQNGHIRCLHRGDWLAGSSGGADCTAATPSPLQNPDRPVLCLWHPDGSAEACWRMVVPDSWPERAHHFLAEVQRNG